ncbi:MAG TPA: CBS domain-containing protein [Polyangiaceae bacterium]|nr:CBS domain-containing protein [Polyangiaceae bacterium]
MTLVRDLMAQDVLSLSPDMPLAEAARALSERQVSAAPVCSADGRVVGVLSTTDVAESFGAGADHTVADAMTMEVLWATADWPVEQAVHRMVFEGVHRLVVLDGSGHLAGIISAMDVLRHLAGFPRHELRVMAVAPPPASPAREGASAGPAPAQGPAPADSATRRS